MDVKKHCGVELSVNTKTFRVQICENLRFLNLKTAVSTAGMWLVMVMVDTNENYFLKFYVACLNYAASLHLRC